MDQWVLEIFRKLNLIKWTRMNGMNGIEMEGNGMDGMEMEWNGRNGRTTQKSQRKVYNKG